MNCQFCGAELPEDAKICSQCGAEIQQPAGENPSGTAEVSQSQKEKPKLWQILLAIVGGVVLALCLAIVVYWGAVGVTSFDEGVQKIAQLVKPRENNVYYKSSYSVSDKKVVKTADKVVATLGDEELTNSLLQLFYWMEVYDYLENYGYYAVYSGLDYTQPLDQQTCKETGGTWQQYFLDKALSKWKHFQSLSIMAESEGYQLEEELRKDLDTLRQRMTDAVLEEGYPSLDAMIQADMGAGTTFDDYEAYMNIYYMGYSYLEDKLDSLEFTDADLQGYYNAHQQELAEDGISKDSGHVVDVRHILVAVQGGTEGEDGEMVYSDEEWEASRTEAQRILDEWLAGEATEESFAELAAEYSEDTGSNGNGGLYESLDESSGFVQEFIDWYMDESRQVGDYGLIKTSYGYHVMYFSGTEAQWLRSCREGLLNEKGMQILSDAAKRYPADIHYKKISLGVVELGQ